MSGGGAESSLAATHQTRAIILCAGLGKRLLPFTHTHPKPILQIHSQTILETIIKQLHSYHISEIFVIVGHLASQIRAFAQSLQFQTLFYPNYATTNSAATLQFVAHLLEGDTLLLNGDCYLANASFLGALLQQQHSTLVAQQIVKTTAPTWGFCIDTNSHLLAVDTDCKGGLCECGIALIRAHDIPIFRQALNDCSPNDYYEHVFLKTLHQCYYQILEVQESVYEIDYFQDALTHHLLSPHDFARQCATNGKAQQLGGLTNYNFKIELNGTKVLRIPGLGTESFVDRELETKITALVPKDIAPETTFYCNYLKISAFLEGYFDQTNYKSCSTHFLESLAITLRKLHSIKLRAGFLPISLLDEISKYESLSQRRIVSKNQHALIVQIAQQLQADEQVLCHRDLLRGNIMYNGKDVKLVDFEYAGFSSRLWDIANFICEFDLSNIQAREFIALYGEVSEKEVNQARILVHYIWGLWYLVNHVKPEEERHLAALNACFAMQD